MLCIFLVNNNVKRRNYTESWFNHDGCWFQPMLKIKINILLLEIEFLPINYYFTNHCVCTLMYFLFYGLWITS